MTSQNKLKSDPRFTTTLNDLLDPLPDNPSIADDYDYFYNRDMFDTFDISDYNQEPEDEAARSVDLDAISPLEKIMNAVDYPGNAVRTIIDQSVQGEDLGKSAYDALNYKKTSATDLKDTITEKTMGQKVRFGRDGPNEDIFGNPIDAAMFDLGLGGNKDARYLGKDPVKGLKQDSGDVIDTAIDFGIDYYTDPLTYVNPALNLGLKLGSKGFKYLNKAEKAAKAAKIFADPKTQAGMGFVYGFGSNADKGEWDENLFDGLVGAATLYGVSRSDLKNKIKGGLLGFTTKEGKKVPGLLSTIADSEVFGKYKGFSDDYSLTNKAYTDINRRATKALDDREKVFKGLSPAKRAMVQDIATDLTNAEVKIRNAYFLKNKDKIANLQKSKSGFDAIEMLLEKNPETGLVNVPKNMSKVQGTIGKMKAQMKRIYEGHFGDDFDIKNLHEYDLDTLPYKDKERLEVLGARMQGMEDALGYYKNGNAYQLMGGIRGLKAEQANMKQKLAAAKEAGDEGLVAELTGGLKAIDDNLRLQQHKYNQAKGATKKYLDSYRFKVRSDYEKSRDEYTKMWEEGNRLAREEVNLDNLDKLGIADNYAEKITNRMMGALKNLEKYNADQLKIYNDFQKDPGKVIQGLRFHMPSFNIADDKIKELAQLRRDELLEVNPSMYLKRRMTEGGGNAKDKLIEKYTKEGMDINAAKNKAYDTLAQKQAHIMAQKTTDKATREAMHRVTEVMQARMNPETKFGKALKNYDDFMKYWKQQVLGFSISWHKNMFGDNLAKAYIESGIAGVWNNLPFSKVAVENMGKLNKVLKGKPIDLQDARLKTFVENGVVDRTNFSDGMADLNKMIYNLSDSTETIPKSFMEKLLYGNQPIGWVNNAINKTVTERMMRYGSNLEQVQRLITAQTLGDQMYKQLIKENKASKAWKTMSKADKSKVMKDTQEYADQMASKMTIDAFFDYSDIHYFNEAVSKRVMPFYTFFSKNVGYWVKSIQDPEKAQRIRNIWRGRRNVGEEPTDQEKLGIANYQRDNNPRKISENDDGDMKLWDTRNMSDYDAVNLLTSPIEGMISRSSPLLQLISEAITGENPRTGRKSTTDSGRSKPHNLGAYGKLGLKLQDLFEPIMGKEDIGFMDLGRDKDGKPVTYNDYIHWGGQAGELLRPNNLLNQILNLTDEKYDALTFDEKLINTLTPTNIYPQDEENQENAEKYKKIDIGTRRNRLERQQDSIMNRDDRRDDERKRKDRERREKLRRDN